MANFISLSEVDLKNVCAAFGVGALVQADPIGQGESNTNARLLTFSSAELQAKLLG